MQKKVNKLVEECTEKIEETKLVEIDLTKWNSVENKFKHNSCALCYFQFFFTIYFTKTLELEANFFFFVGT